MTTMSIQQIQKLAAVAEELIVLGYPIYTIYADQNEIHVDMPEGMADPAEIESVDYPQQSQYEHRHGSHGGVRITWLASKQGAAA